MASEGDSLGSLSTVGFLFAPVGWAVADGSVLPVSQHHALFELLRAVYGGDGVTTFGLPDLRGRQAIGAGAAPGLTPRPLGAQVGAETATLTLANLPTHGHPVTLGAAPTTPGSGPARPYAGGGSDAGRLETDSAGEGQPFSVQSPALAVTYVIHLGGATPIDA